MNKVEYIIETINRMVLPQTRVSWEAMTASNYFRVSARYPRSDYAGRLTFTRLTFTSENHNDPEHIINELFRKINRYERL